MASWATRRKISYSIIFIGILIALFFVFFGDDLKTPPTCTDLKQNQEEVGVDCGGSCSELCLSQVNDFVVEWSRSLRTSFGVYDVVGFIENPNGRGGVEELAYSFKLYDRDNILITERTGTTFANANETFPILETKVRVGDRLPSRVFLTLERLSPWTVDAVTIPDLTISNRQFELADPVAKVRASIANSSLFDVEDIVITALLFDENDNAIAVSKTEVDFLAKDGQRDISFIFPHQVTQTPARIEILPRVQVVGSGR